MRQIKNTLPLILVTAVWPISSLASSPTNNPLLQTSIPTEVQYSVEDYEKLIKAASKGKRKTLRKWVEKHPGFDVEYRDENGRTALSHAAGANKAENVQLLISLGADVDSKDSKGVPVLNWSAWGRQFGNTGILLDAGADPKATNANGLSALHFAAGQGNLEAVKVLLDAGADIDVGKETTPLGYSVYHGKVDVARYLITAGADLTRPYHDYSVLDIADGIAKAYKDAGYSKPLIWTDDQRVMLAGAGKLEDYTWDKKVSPPQIKVDSNGRLICPPGQWVGVSEEEKPSVLYAIKQSRSGPGGDSNWASYSGNHVCWTRFEAIERTPYRGNTVLKLKVDVVWPYGNMTQCLGRGNGKKQESFWDSYEKDVACSPFMIGTSGPKAPKPKGTRESFFGTVEY